MKNYLKDDLSTSEKKEIIGIIWMTVKNHKFKISKKEKGEIKLIDDLDLSYNDFYSFERITFKDYSYSNPLTKEGEIDIVNQLNILIDEVCLSQLKRTLTFNEKLVFFFIFLEKYKSVKVSFLLSVDRKTIYNYKRSIKDKIDKMKGEL